MALVSRNAGDSIRSLDIDQIVQALTGLMPDQAMTLAAALSVYGTLNAQKVVSPTITSAPVGGTPGSTTHNYKIVAVGSTDAIPGPQYGVTNCAATLDASHTVTPTWPAVSGANSYKVLRDGQTIGTVTAIQGQTSAYSLLDQGQTGTTYTATTTNPGGLLQASGYNAPVLLNTANSLVGSPPPLATTQWLVQAGTSVVSFTAGNGTLTLPSAFPNGLLTVVVTNGDSAVNNNLVLSATAGSCTTSTVPMLAVAAPTGAGFGSSVRVNWVAYGW